MEKERIIRYLLIKGYNENQILNIMKSSAMRNQMEKVVLEYDMKLAYTGQAKADAVETFDTYQRLQLQREKEKLLQIKRVGR